MFEPEPQEAPAAELGGRYVTTLLGPTLWTLAIDTTPGNEREFSLWRAWLDSLDGGSRQFVGYDVRRPMPWNYRRTGFAELTRAVSGGAFDGTSSAWSANADADAIEIGDASGQQLPSGFELIEGDYIGLTWDGGDGLSLHRVIEPASASASGVGEWTVRPHLPAQIPNTATVNLVKPGCLMRVTKRDRDAEHKSRRIGFEAIQDLVLP